MATITETPQSKLEQAIRRLPGVGYLKSDLMGCIEALLEIRDGDSSADVAANTARVALRDLITQVQCGACGGDGRVSCSNCNGGGTSEHPCYVCANFGDVACPECYGKGVV